MAFPRTLKLILLSIRDLIASAGPIVFIVIGLLIAQFAVALMAWLGSLPFLFDVQINVIAFAISAIIGVVFGYFPARRAASLNPIDALRHE